MARKFNILPGQQFKARYEGEKEFHAAYIVENIIGQNIICSGIYNGMYEEKESFKYSDFLHGINTGLFQIQRGDDPNALPVLPTPAQRRLAAFFKKIGELNGKYDLENMEANRVLYEDYLAFFEISIPTYYKTTYIGEVLETLICKIANDPENAPQIVLDKIESILKTPIPELSNYGGIAINDIARRWRWEAEQELAGALADCAETYLKESHSATNYISFKKEAKPNGKNF